MEKIISGNTPPVRNWTDPQKNSIESRGRALCVSAGAGSGKTATLIERIKRLITDPETHADVSRMLVVTFTNKAAAELRARITDSLSEYLGQNPDDARVASQMSKIGGAQICTIDAYYRSLAVRNIQNTGLPVSFGIADTADKESILSAVINPVVERLFETEAGFPALASLLTSPKNEGNLPSELRNIYLKTAEMHRGGDLYLDAADNLRKAASGDFFASYIGRLYRNTVVKKSRQEIERCEILESRFDLASFGRYKGAVEYLKNFLEEIIAAAESENGYAKAVEISAAYSYPGIGMAKPATIESKEAKDRIYEVKTNVEKIRKDFLTMTPEELSKRLCRCAETNAATGAAVEAVRTAYVGEMHRRGLSEFSEVHTAVKSLLIDSDGNPTPLALAERERYDYIFVDEYQDTDEDQDLIFRTISRGNNTYFVGDIKQSIYRFRNANPEVFSSYRARWPELTDSTPEGESASVYMSDNFRCSDNIIKFTNGVCGALFRDASASRIFGEGIRYSGSDDLISHAEKPEPPVRIVRIDDNDEEKTKKYQHAFLVSDVKRLAEELRDPTTGFPGYGRIAILARKNDSLIEASEALSAAGIPAVLTGKKKLFENPEVLLFCSILAAVDNPMRDVYLAGALRSPVFGLSISDLVTVRAAYRDMTLWESINAYAQSEEAKGPVADRCRDAAARLRGFRITAASMPVDRFVRLLWKDTFAETYAGAADDGGMTSPLDRGSNLRELYEYARSAASKGNGTLHDLVSTLTGFIESGKTIEIENPAREGAVRLMTIHQSKGLEFDVVYLLDTHRSFYIRCKKGDVFTPAGLMANLSDETGLSKTPHPLESLWKTYKNELERDENMCLFYVALTRAKKRLILVCAISSNRKSDELVDTDGKFGKKTRGFSRGNAAYEGDSYDDWLSFALNSFGYEDSCTIEDYAKEDFGSESDAKQPDSDVQTPEAAPAADPALTEKLRRRISFVYPYERSVSVPVKLSVSNLYPDILADDEPPAIPEPGEKTVPRFVSGRDGAAEKGVATHLFLQFCDFIRDYRSEDEVRGEIGRLIERGFISERDASLIRVRELVRFFGSAFFKDIRLAKRILREKRFTYLSDASEHVEDPAQKLALKGEKVLIQGVIDVMYEKDDGSVVLCDYKTDRIPSEIRDSEEAVTRLMKERHVTQLSYYGEAIKTLFGKYPDETLVFPLDFGKAVRIQ